MAFPISASLLDAVVLAVVEKEETYGYKITQDVREIVDVSESTLYPVLRRLLKEECLKTYDKEYYGRNRRYYQITQGGKAVLAQYRCDWIDYRKKVDSIMLKSGVK